MQESKKYKCEKARNENAINTNARKRRIQIREIDKYNCEKVRNANARKQKIQM